MMDETILINHIKHQLCFVSPDFHRDLKITHSPPPSNPIAREYVLPDYRISHTGFVRDVSIQKSTDESGDNDDPMATDQILKMNNERICVPELLFQPSIVGGCSY
jgi:actin-related protein 6